MSTAKIIVIDGGANVGKATQADMLMHRLLNENHGVKKMDFPRYNQNTIGRLIQDCLSGKHGSFKELDPKIVAMLYAADRFESKQQIEEWMADGQIIIFDRYVSANMLHQGAKIEDPDQREEFFRWLEHVEFEVFGLPRPDLTIYLDIPPDETQKLLEYVENFGVTVIDPEEQDRLHQAKVSKCASYLATTHEHWETVQCMNEAGLRTRDDIHQEVYAIVERHLKQPDHVPVA